ncbi:MAG: ChaN family lipoprotein [Deltaproteobacteria bacterium]|nr:ChaN family lipoprotein [Deltaproteobacteria bacterium]
MAARAQLIRIQRNIYDRLKQYARNYLEGLGPGLKQYFREYQRDFYHFESLSTKRELLLALERSHIIFCGDYHTLSQAQRTVIRLLRDSVDKIKRRGKHVVLALEMLQPKNNKAVKNFLGGRLSEQAFLKTISFGRQWGFPWENYRPLFDFARSHDVSIVGVNSPQKRASLSERDRYAAQVVASLSATDPAALIFVLMGDLHLAQDHLPKETQRILDKLQAQRSLLTIHQNNETFYWKLVEKGLEHDVEVIRIKKNIFCVMTTPPWIKLQSHLKWMEVTSDKSAFSSKVSTQEIVKPADVFQETDFSDEIREIVEAISQFFGIKEKITDNFVIYGNINKKALSRLAQNHHYTKRETALLGYYVTQLESLFVPRENLIYLTSFSLNQMASQSAILIHAELSGFRRVFGCVRKDFYAFVLIEALGFIGSKVINHKRKCKTVAQLKDLLAEEKGNPHGLATLTLAHLEAEEKMFSLKRKSLRFALPGSKASMQTTLAYYRVAKTLGQMLGQAIYQALVKGQVHRADAAHLFSCSFNKHTENRQIYLHWVRMLESCGCRKMPPLL